MCVLIEARMVGASLTTADEGDDDWGGGEDDIAISASRPAEDDGGDEDAGTSPPLARLDPGPARLNDRPLTRVPSTTSFASLMSSEFVRLRMPFVGVSPGDWRPDFDRESADLGCTDSDGRWAGEYGWDVLLGEKMTDLADRVLRADAPGERWVHAQRARRREGGTVEVSSELLHLRPHRPPWPSAPSDSTSSHPWGL